MQGRRPNYAWVDISLAERKRRLLSKVKKRIDGCWEWLGKRFVNGYGCVHINFQPKKTSYLLAHRVFFEIFGGKRLGRKQALHRCDHPWCVRPSHLFRGTARMNVQDMLRKGRQNWAYGERSGRAKLTAKKVRAMRLAHAGGISQRSLATRFGVSPKQISTIVNRKQWRHLP